MRIWFEDQMVMDEWRQQEPSKFAFQIELNGVEAYKIEVEYNQIMYDHAVAQLYWEYPSQFKTILPVRYLYPTKPENCIDEQPEIIAEVSKKRGETEGGNCVNP